jgi:hypothetical protein
MSRPQHGKSHGKSRGARIFPHVVSALLALGASGVAAAAPQVPNAPSVTTIHPVYAASDVPQSDVAHKAFTAAVGRHQMGPVEVIDIPGPPDPRAKGLLATGRTAVEAKRFADAEVALRAAANEAQATGAAGLTSAELSDVFLYLGMALQQADWKDPPAPVTEITPGAAREAYLRAAVLAGDRVLLPRQFPPLAIASWQLAQAEVKKRPRSNLIVRVPETALVSIDGGELRSGLLPALDLVQGEHWVRVEDPGRRRYGAMVVLNEPSREIEVEAQPVLSLPAAPAAAQARREGAAFALLAELKPGRPSMIQLRLLHAANAEQRDSALVPVSDAAALEAAVVHLDEVARRQRFGESTAAVISAPALGEIALAPVDARPIGVNERLSDSPRAWLKTRWPVLTAVGVAVGAALVLGVMVAHDDGH